MSFKILDLSKGIFENKYSKVILLGIAAVCVVILLLPGKKQTDEPEEPKAVTTLQYINQAESKIEKMVSSIEGAGKCRVVLSCKNGEESVLAREDSEAYQSRLTTRENGRKILIIKEKGGGESPVVTKTIMPEFKGAVILCRGAENPKTKRLVIEAVSVALNMKTNNISVIKSDN